MIYNYKLLKAFPPKHLENSSAQWAIFLIQNLILGGKGMIYTVLHLQIIASISPKASREFISPVGYFLMVSLESTCQHIFFVSSALFF